MIHTNGHPLTGAARTILNADPDDLERLAFEIRRRSPWHTEAVGGMVYVVDADGVWWMTRHEAETLVRSLRAPMT